MTLTTAIESAFYDLITKQEIGGDTLVRCWHGLRKDTKWDFSVDKVLPCIDIRCAPAIPAENKTSLMARCQIKIVTNGKDDKSHEEISKIEDAVQTALDTLYAELYAGATGATWTAFQTSILTDYPSVSHIGGIDIEQGDEPQDDDGNPLVGFIVVVHCSRNDY